MVKIIENYTLHEQIGEGEYGKVFRGVDSRTKKEVAVKVINVKKFKQYPKLEQCTLNQIQVLSKIDCIHIVKFIEILKTANNFYFFYEFCNQGTLEDIIKSKGTLSEHQVLEYTSQILEGFQILTSKHIMHRDLKPSNILINDGLIKLADFGFCKSLQSHRDLAQTMLGSPIYMAPQVLKGQIYTIKADIWSLGVVIYEMIYGFCPFQERSIARLINLVENQSVSFNSQINQISPELQGLVRRMLVKDHFKRISWNEIFQYRINGVSIAKNNQNNQNKNYQNEKPIENYHSTGINNLKINAETCNIPFMKTISSQQQQSDKKQNRQQKYDRYQYNNELKQIKNYENKSERAISRPLSIVGANQANYQESYFSKSNNTSAKKSQSQKTNENGSNTTAPTMFKKKVSNTNALAQVETVKNKQNITEINSNGLRSKIYHYIKITNDIVKWNFCPEITANLCLKIYNILQKEHNKIPQNLYSSQIREQRECIAQTIRIFKQQSQKSDISSLNGPLLTYYIKSLQNTQKDLYENTSNLYSKNKNRQILIHCLSLLELNQLNVYGGSSNKEITKNKNSEYDIYSKQKLLAEISQKVIRNVI